MSRRSKTAPELLKTGRFQLGRSFKQRGFVNQTPNLPPRILFKLLMPHSRSKTASAPCSPKSSFLSVVIVNGGRNERHSGSLFRLWWLLPPQNHGGFLRSCLGVVQARRLHSRCRAFLGAGRFPCSSGQKRRANLERGRCRRAGLRPACLRDRGLSRGGQAFSILIAPR